MNLTDIQKSFATRNTVAIDDNNLQIQYTLYNHAGESVIVDDWTINYHRLDLQRMLENAQTSLISWQNFNVQSRVDDAQEEIDRVNQLLAFLE